MTTILAERRESSAKRLQDLQNKLQRAKEISAEKACVYVTGSFGRGEASPHSDLDLFIAGLSMQTDSKEERTLNNLDETCLKAELIHATRALKFQEFSGDGEYLVHYTINELVRTTGKPEDDARNTFTARLLLLLESRPVLEDTIYQQAIDAVIAQYWRDYKDHNREFVPAFLANDILRLWRTFCVNYEARTSDVPEAKKNKRRLKNYKLKFSRMLTCYSAIVYLLATYNEFNTVNQDDVRKMVAKTPTERLEWLLTLQRFEGAHPVAKVLLEQYSGFLVNTNAPEDELLVRFADKATRQRYFAQATEFGDSVFGLIELVGQKSRFHRLLLV
jgi:predicted nucleotidyltransferase